MVNGKSPFLDYCHLLPDDQLWHLIRTDACFGPAAAEELMNRAKSLDQRQLEDLAGRFSHLSSRVLEIIEERTTGCCS